MTAFQTTTILSLPEALDCVLAYLADERADYDNSPARRSGRIWEAAQVLARLRPAAGDDIDTLAITALIEPHGYIAAIWHIDDIKIDRPDLSDEQCKAVLDECASCHDAEIGINWDVIRCWAEELFPEREAL